MTLNDPSLPSEPEPVIPPRPRRRRRGQLIVLQDAEGRAAILNSLAKRAYPSYELFVFAMLCGALLGLGYFFDSQAVLIFGILLAPLLTPWIGLLLSALTGSSRFFFETFMALLISSVLIFLSGLLAGFAVRAVLPRTLNEAFLHSHLWWPDLIVLAIAAVILTLSFVRSEDKPYLPSVMLAYELFLPLSAGGFGLGSGVSGIWPNGVLVFVVYFAWAGLFGLLTLMALRFLPKNLNAFALSAGSLLVFVVVLVGLMTGAKWTVPSMPQSRTAPTPMPTLPTLTLSMPTVSADASLPQASSTPAIDAATATVGDTPTGIEVPAMTTATVGAALTQAASLQLTMQTPTITLTVQPTPVYARVNASQGNGANLRKDPNGRFLIEIDNGSIVEVQPDTQDVSGVTWAHVIAIRNGQRYDGWILQSVLEIATPVPLWVPTSTPAESETPIITSTP